MLKTKKRRKKRISKSSVLEWVTIKGAQLIKLVTKTMMIPTFANSSLNSLCLLLQKVAKLLWSSKPYLTRISMSFCKSTAFFSNF